MMIEKVSRIVLCIVMTVLLILIVKTVIDDYKPKNMVFAAEAESVKDFIEESAGRPKKGEISLSGMPCENPEQFERWLKEHEQTTGEESHETEGESLEGCVEESRFERDNEISGIEETSSEVAAESESNQEPSKIQSVPEEASRIYRIMGEEIDPYVQKRLYMVLAKAGIAYWYETAICQLFQESRGNCGAVSKDGKDHGIFQFRLEYWDEVCEQYGHAGASIYDVDVQIDIYVRQTAARLNAGLSADEVISRHKTSDYVTEIDWQYVAQVRQWFEQMEAIK